MSELQRDVQQVEPWQPAALLAALKDEAWNARDGCNGLAVSWDDIERIVMHRVAVPDAEKAGA